MGVSVFFRRIFRHNDAKIPQIVAFVKVSSKKTAIINNERVRKLIETECRADAFKPQVLREWKMKLFFGMIFLVGVFFCASGETTTTELRPPLILEILSLQRDNLEFLDVFGAHLKIKQPFRMVSEEPAEPDELFLQRASAETPDDTSHFQLQPVAFPEPGVGIITSADFQAKLKISRRADGRLEALVETLTLDNRHRGDTIPIRLVARSGRRLIAFRIHAPSGIQFHPVRVGELFVGNEIPELEVEADYTEELDLHLFDHATGRRIGERHISARGGVPQRIPLPEARFGVTRAELRRSKTREIAAETRLVRIPEPVKLSPEDSRIGINLFQQQLWSYSYQLPFFAKAGVHHIRPWLAWENLWKFQEPEEGKIDFSHLDAMLRRIKFFNMEYWHIFYSAPAWLVGRNSRGIPLSELELQRTAQYLEKLAADYRGRIRYFEIWNEPDHTFKTSSPAIGARNYSNLLRTAAPALKRGNPDVVILGPSEAGIGDMAFISELRKYHVEEYIDIFSTHTYNSPGSFLATIKPRIQLFLPEIPPEKWCVNETGTSADDLRPEFNRRFHTSETIQADYLVKNYAQALAVAPDLPVFWFCTLDPRDTAAENPQWDAAIGVCYMGLKPKLAFPALAQFARMTAGKRCIGQTSPLPGITAVGFADDTVLIWSDRETPFQPAEYADCANAVIVQDIYGNHLDSSQIILKSTPVWLSGVPNLNTRIRREAAIDRVRSFGVHQSARIVPEENPVVEFTVPAGTRLQTLSTLQVREEVLSDTRRRVIAEGGSGDIRVQLDLPDGMGTIYRGIRVGSESAFTIPDGAFFRGDLQAWRPEQSTNFAWDPLEGAAAPGSLKFFAPFNQRLGLWRPLPENDGIRFSMACKALNFNGNFTVNLAFFHGTQWLKTILLAYSSNGAPDGSELCSETVHLNPAENKWQHMEETLPAKLIPAGTDQYVLFLDAPPAETGTLWFDDLKLEFLPRPELKPITWISEKQFNVDEWNRAWIQERKSQVAWDTENDAIRFDAPFDRRIHRKLPFSGKEAAGRTLDFSMQWRGEGTMRAVMFLAFFDAQGKWLRTTELASSDRTPALQLILDGQWHSGTTQVSPAEIPANAAEIALIADLSNGNSGTFYLKSMRLETANPRERKK